MSIVLGDTHPRARLSHVCEDCGRVIGPGETYRRVRGIDDCGDGDPFTFKQCEHCEAFVGLYIDDFAPWADDDGYDSASIREWDPETPTATEHKRQWQAKWHTSSGDLEPVPRRAVTR